MTAASIGTYPLGGTIRYYINQAGCAGIPDDSEFVAVQRGFQEWEDDLGSYVDFTYMGTTNLGASLFSGSEDGANFVQWVNAGATGWSAATYSPLTGNPLREQDIVFNDFYVWSTTGATNAFDVQNIATHEAGHFLRLLDLTGVGDADQAMYLSAAPGETNKRTLEWGDRAGMRYIYPERHQVGGAL